MYRLLHERYPYAHCELDFDTPLQLLVATVLSAQTTDVMVNKVTPTLFARWPTAADLAAADRTEMEEVLRPTGFYRAKTNSVLKLAAAIVEEHEGVEVAQFLGQIAILRPMAGAQRRARPAWRQTRLREGKRPAGPAMPTAPSLRARPPRARSR